MLISFTSDFTSKGSETPLSEELTNDLVFFQTLILLNPELLEVQASPIIPPIVV